MQSPQKEEEKAPQDEPLMQTDELIDLYSADPITGRSKKDDDSQENISKALLIPL